MGMFDRLYDGEVEWQTKAYDCVLADYEVGDEMPPLIGVLSYQVKIMGGPHPDDCLDSLATVVDGVLKSVDNERAHSLPLVSYGGDVIERGAL